MKIVRPVKISKGRQVIYQFFLNEIENRLSSIIPLNLQNGDTKTEYAYDYMGRRVQKKMSVYNAGSWSLLQDVGGLLSTTNNLTSNTYLYTFDANGNVGQLVESSTGTIAAHYEYDAFGNTLVADGQEAKKNPFRFSTKYFMPEFGWYDYGRRYYSPKLGRWPIRDPIGEQGGVNLYGFVENNPVSSYDELGLYPATPGHGSIISPTKSVWLINRLQEDADHQLDFVIRERENVHVLEAIFTDPSFMVSYERNTYRLHIITGLPYPYSDFHGLEGGGGVISHRTTNKFVYTCKYGWIDHGHFFYNAYATYLLGRGLTALFAELNELKQTFQGNASAYSPEDKTSNWLGRQFGKRMAAHDSLVMARPGEILPVSAFFDIANEWEQLLKGAGAVKWGRINETGPLVQDLLESELQRYGERTWTKADMLMFGSSVAGNQLYKALQPEWRCLCNGPIPKDEYLRF